MSLAPAAPRDDSIQRRLLRWHRAWLDDALAWRSETEALPRFTDSATILPSAFAAGGALAPARAAIAHIAAHRRHGGARYAVGSLKPVEVILVSLVEDARVEQLAMAARPGLRALWRPLLDTGGEEAGVPGLLRRLAIALFDLDSRDGNAWVDKGRRLFREHRAEWADPALSRRLGNLLANDLGQMRQQFNWRSYRPPRYRDDHHGLWDFEAAEEERTAELTAAPPEPGGFDAAPLLSEPRGVAGGNPPGAAPAAAAGPLLQLPEWDYARGLLRPRWVQLRAEANAPGDATALETLLAARTQQVQELARRLRALRGERRRRRRQSAGDEPDLDACIEQAVDRRSGRAPDHRLYVAAQRPRRDLALLLLLDASRSTAAPAAGAPASPATLELEREAAALLAAAAQAGGDRCAIAAFRSSGRDDVRLATLKSFATPWDANARSALAGLRPGLSTRLGAALRGAGRELARQRNAQRWLLVITDGEPADIDAPDPRYLVEDARRAVAELHRAGIAVFGLGLDPAEAPSLRRIFGRRRLLVERPERLADALQGVYRRLAERAG